MAVPMTQEALHIASSTMTIPERLIAVRSIMQSIDPVNHNDLKCVTKAFEIFQIATHNLNNLQQPSPYEKRKLFCTAQMSIQSLAQCIAERLEVPFPDNERLDELEMNYKVLHLNYVNFKGSFARERATALGNCYRAIVEDPNAYFSDLVQVQQVIEIALGDGTERRDVVGALVPLPLNANAITGMSKESLVEWKQHMNAFAISTLIVMAKAVSEKFGGQAVHLLGTLIPVSAFA